MWPNPQETENLVAFAEEVLIGKFYFLYSAILLVVILHFEQI